jgi:hypothetical protein
MDTATESTLIAGDRLARKLFSARPQLSAATVARALCTRRDLIAAEQRTCVEQQMSYRRRALEIVPSDYGRSGGSAADRVAVAIGLALAEQRDNLVDHAIALERDLGLASGRVRLQVTVSLERTLETAELLDALLADTPLEGPVPKVPALARELGMPAVAV